MSPGTLVAGKLRVVRLVGQGGMGAVYEVEHEITKHRRALKLLHPDFAAVPGVVARFLNEASAAGRIGNRHIVETFDAGTLEGGEPYIVMELLRGQSLAKRLQERPRLDFEEAFDIVSQACVGAGAAHDAGILHRDIKPDNLFIVDGEPRVVKLLDFGVSKFDTRAPASSSLTQEGSTLGTPLYMSPEQLRGELDLDGRSDVYSLGICLYEAITGSKPFYAATIIELALLVHDGKYVPVADRRPDMPLELEAVVARALAVDRKHRFPSASSLREALASVPQKVSVRGGTVVMEGARGASAHTAPHGTSAAARRRGADAPALAAADGDAPIAEAGTAAPRTERASVSPGKPSSKRPALAVAALLAIVAAGAAVAWRTAGGTPATAEPQREALPRTAIGATPPDVLPVVAPAELPLARDAAPAASAMPRTVEPRSRPVPGAPTPAAGPSPGAGPSRAQQHGLTKNPF